MAKPVQYAEIRPPASPRDSPLEQLLATIHRYFAPHRHTALLAAIIAAFAVRPLIGDTGAGSGVFGIALVTLLLVALFNIDVDELVGKRGRLQAQRRRCRTITFGLLLFASGSALAQGVVLPLPPEDQQNITAAVGPAVVGAALLPNPARAVPAATAPPTDEATEVNKELSNPISSIWALQIQENTFFIHPGIEDKSSRNSVNVQFQPVLPLALTDDWNLITRPVFQVVNSVPVPTRTGRIYQATGFGDTILATLLSPSPKLAGPWLLGAGPTFIFPTATTTNVGQKKWQVGPCGVFGYLGEHYIVGVFPQQWFSVGGNGSKQTSQMNLQYFAAYFLPHGWSVGTSPNMLINWYASGGNKVTFPIGLNVAKVQKIGPLPVKFQVQGQYMPVNPSVFGQRWNIQVSITPVIPKLIKGNLFGD